MEWITLVGGILEEVLALATTATTGQTASIISMLDKFITLAVSAAPNLLQPIQNIIAALQGNGSVTAEQVAALQAQSDAVDAALDAAAAADGLAGANPPGKALS